ncbi:TonB-dependent receptor plug domain-containing protein [Pseudoduganella sp. GCM10020061]|uniref:TonB-dependent receptor plug domain-containing protein n=1 Tax=Pseudoduganella sp. GCM10020061 TaxID=3317345 RepID=UPI0036436317
MALGAMSAYAQTTTEAPAPAEMQRVEVTGSRIRAVDLETAQPVQVMNAEQIQKTGLVTLGDIVNNLTSVGSPNFSKGGVLTSNREQGGDYINMRGLGAQRMLVLVNGKRWTTTVGGFTDFSTIPTSMVERMEILKDGASAIYGSDAIAGVVNFILKKNMQGGDASAYVGQNEDGDGKSEAYHLTYGAGDDKASLMFALTHSKRGAIWARDRELTKYTYGPGKETAGLVGGVWGRIRQVSASGGATGFNRVINHTGTYDGAGTGAVSRDPANYHNFTGAVEDLYNASQDMMFNSPTQLSTMFTKGAVSLPHDIQLTTTASYSDRKAIATVAGYPASSTMQPKNPVYLSKDSYYNPYGNQVAGAGLGQDLFWYRRTMEVPRQTTNRNRTIHVDVNLEGEFSLGQNAWNWSVGVNHNNLIGTTDNTGNLNLVQLKKALGPSFLNAAGQVQCGTPTAPIALSECVPFDIIGGPSASTPAALKFVMADGHATYGSTVNSYTADIGGEVWQLPAGALGFAAGIEKREVEGYDRPNALDQLNLTSSLAGKSTFGKYDVKEAYVELNIPVLKGMRFAELLSFNLASRYSDYSSFGDTTNSKISFMYKPNKDMLFRGTFAEGFRAPTLGDTFGGGSQTFDTYLDPCDTAWGQAATNPEVKTRCTAGGVPATFRQVNSAGTPVPNTGAQTPFPFESGAGNEFLQPETAETRTLGLVYSPSYVAGLTVGLDWFDIRVSDRITAVGTGYILNQCYVAGVSQFCGLFKRDPVSGQVVELRRGNANLGKQSTEGVDITVNYRLPATAWGKFGVRSETTYLDSYIIQSTATSTPFNYAGEYGQARWKSNTSVDWNMGNWSATMSARYVSHVKVTCWTATEECNTPLGQWSGGEGYDLKGSVTYYDLVGSYAFPWKGKLLVGVNNVFGKKPRINYDASASASSVDPDVPLDRFFYVRYNQSF